MSQNTLLNDDWDSAVERLGGKEQLKAGAKATNAFLRARAFKDAVDMLRMILAYCLSDNGLRSTAAWAASIGLVDVANTALLYRLRQSEKWLTSLVEQTLASSTPQSCQGRVIRVVDATNVRKAGVEAKTRNRVWRVHSAFDLPCERFGYFELTDEHGGERLDRIPVIKGEIRLGDRAYLQPDRMATILEAGADVVVRAGWRNARWLDDDNAPVDLIAEFKAAAASGRIDRSIRIGRKSGPALAMRLIAIKKSPEAAEAAKKKAREKSRSGGKRISEGTLIAAEWMILVTSLSAEKFSTDDILSLYRLRWRIELAFKRLKSILGLKPPPGVDERSAKPYVLAHLLMILLLEPLIDELEDSPRLAAAA